MLKHPHLHLHLHLQGQLVPLLLPLPAVPRSAAGPLFAVSTGGTVCRYLRESQASGLM